MSHKKDQKSFIQADEIECLNVDDLDVEELERRIELASASPIIPDLWSCDTFSCSQNTK